MECEELGETKMNGGLSFIVVEYQRYHKTLLNDDCLAINNPS